MSSYYRQIAKRKDFLNLLKELQKRLAKRERVADPLETIEFKHFLRSNNDRLLIFTKATNETNAVVTDPNQKYYQLPAEPDGNKLRVWYRFNDFAGGTVKDWSGLENTGTVVGSPTKQEGHVVHMNGMAFDGTNNYFIRVPHKSPDTSIAGLTTGFGISVWVKPSRLDLHGGKPRVIACKIDDDFNTKDRGWSLWVEPNGTVYFVVKLPGTIYVRRATNALQVMDQWYHITAFFDVDPNFMITPLHVNSIEYTGEIQTLNDREPWLPVGSATGISMVIGGTDEVGASKWAGVISDFRYFYEKVYTHADAAIQFTNKYTISDINYVALVGVATTAYEEIGQTPPQPGETPPPPPPASDTVGSFSATSFSSTSFTVNSTGQGQGGGGGGTVTPSIPDQVFDDFTFSPKYTLTTLNQVSPDSRWKLNVIPTTAGYVRTEDYTAPNDSIARSVLRMKSGGTSTTHPILTLNSARFYDISFKCLVRTVSQTTAGTTNAPWIIFKYLDASNYYYAVLTTTGMQLAKVVGGVTTVIATQSNPGGNILYPVGSLHEVLIESKADGTIIRISVDQHATPPSAIFYEEPSRNPPDTVITALTSAGFRAVNSDFVTDNVLIKPIFGDSFQASTYVINTVGDKSPNLKWETIVRAGGSGGTIRTYDHSSHSTGGRVLNLNSGTSPGSNQPLVLSTSEWNGVDFRCDMATLSQHVVAEANRMEMIFKYKDSSNYYWMQYFPDGFKIKRKIAGVDETLVTNLIDNYPDNPAYPFYLARIFVYNSGRDIKVFSNFGIDYEQHDAVDGWYTDDNGVLSGVGRVGFRAPNCNAVADNIYVERL